MSLIEVVLFLVVAIDWFTSHPRRNWCILLWRVLSPCANIWCEVIWFWCSIDSGYSIALVHGVNFRLWATWTRLARGILLPIGYWVVVCLATYSIRYFLCLWLLPHLYSLLSSLMVVLIRCVVIFESIWTTAWATPWGRCIAWMLSGSCLLLL